MSTVASWISAKAGRAGGAACVRDTRITVWGLAARRRLGGTDAEILRSAPGLTHADLEAAWEYAATHCEEIEQAIRGNELGESGFVE